jgi:hypothetical protein
MSEPKSLLNLAQIKDDAKDFDHNQYSGQSTFQMIVSLTADLMLYHLNSHRYLRPSPRALLTHPISGGGGAGLDVKSGCWHSTLVYPACCSGILYDAYAYVELIPEATKHERLSSTIAIRTIKLLVASGIDDNTTTEVKL